MGEFGKLHGSVLEDQFLQIARIKELSWRINVSSSKQNKNLFAIHLHFPTNETPYEVHTLNWERWGGGEGEVWKSVSMCDTEAELGLEGL